LPTEVVISLVFFVRATSKRSVDGCLRVACTKRVLYHFDRVFSHASQPIKKTVLKTEREFFGLLGEINFQNPEHPVEMVQYGDK
jgi:hypothetical protein